MTPTFHHFNGAPDAVAPFSLAVEADGWVSLTRQMPFPETLVDRRPRGVWTKNPAAEKQSTIEDDPYCPACGGIRKSDPISCAAAPRPKVMFSTVRPTLRAG